MLQLRCWGNFKAQHLQLNARCGNRQRGAAGKGAVGERQLVAVEKLPQNVFENDFEPRLLIRRLPAACQFVDYVAIIWAQTATPHALHTRLHTPFHPSICLAVATTVSCHN